MAKTITVRETADQIGKQVTVKGWVHSLRDMGKISFIDLRDHTGLVQVVCPDTLNLPRLGSEYVVAVTGTVRERDPRFHNPKLATGKIEVGAEGIEVLNEAADLPFEISKDTADVHEELRLQYRYLDLRSERMAANLRLRYEVIKFMRQFLDKHDFIEVETPLLTKGTPEGAREFIVPSRLHPEQFYVLPQSPQQFKQLLMVAGFGRYFQLARCLRDEDQRGDRQPEFTQVDLELSFVDQEDVLALNEAMMTEMTAKLFPGKKITQTPFPRFTYQEVMDKYGTDKPDLRADKSDPDELAFCWITEFPMFEINHTTSKIDAVHHPFTAPRPDDIDKLSKRPTEVRADAYDLALNGFEVGGGSIRIHNADLQHKVFELLGLSQEDIKARFGHILEAFKYGVPPHGGFAYGYDRLVMVLAGEPNIREVMAFPKTGDARDPLTGAPSELEPERLKEANIEIRKTKRG